MAKKDAVPCLPMENTAKRLWEIRSRQCHIGNRGDQGSNLKRASWEGGADKLGLASRIPANPAAPPSPLRASKHTIVLHGVSVPPEYRELKGSRAPYRPSPTLQLVDSRAFLELKGRAYGRLRSQNHRQHRASF